MIAQRLTPGELARLESVIADGEITHNLPTIMRLVATVRNLESQLHYRMISTATTFIPFEGAVN